MILVEGKLISEALLQEQFLCNLNACKGACCWEGDYGAPLEEEELDTLKAIYPKVKPFLSPAGISIIEKEGPFTWYEEAEEFGTPLIQSGACAYMTFDDKGIAQCGIEQAYSAGEVDYKKPISCHLYPVRSHYNPKSDYEILNYDEWEICSAACELGAKEQMPVYRFVRDALIRKYGHSFWETLDELYWDQWGTEKNKGSKI